MDTAKPELVFGLVGAIGTDLGQVEEALRNALSAVGYLSISIKLSDLMRELNPPWSKFPERDNPEYYDKAMTAGNKLRKKLHDSSALAKLAIASIRRRRDKARAEASQSVAYILNSLKRREEIEQLRQIYGPSVFIISAYSPREARVSRLAVKLAEKEHENQSSRHRAKAEGLITRDENENNEFGQGVRGAYPLADLFVTASSTAAISDSIDRFIHVLFGHFWKTPTRDDEGMSLAYLASVRSASAARQVGAAITDDKGRVVSIGVNEVPRAGGGQYWENDPGDGRDFLYDDYDLSDKMRFNLLSDVIDRLRKLKRLSTDCPTNVKLLSTKSIDYQLVRKAQLFDTIDFVRVVHAEASALFAAGVAARGATLYVTTFPCHECARHIVAAGIRRVVYIEPYPKSLVAELFRDSISVDVGEPSDQRIQFVPFSGVAPTIYGQLFQVGSDRNRKEKNGKIIKWAPGDAFPHLSVSYSENKAHIAEAALILEFRRTLGSKGILNDKNRRTAGKGLAVDSNAGRRRRGV